MSITANIVADSINSSGNRITTFVVHFPRIVLAELNTHRALSKNSASSRAIPLEKMLEMVKTNPFIPIKFQKDHKGMQGTEYYDGEDHDKCIQDWLSARDAAVNAALNFKLPVTKQLRNRLLEPFMWHKVIITATDFENFFALRAHKDAEIHISELAYKMLDEYNKSIPTKLNVGQWHIPFGDRFDDAKLTNLVLELNNGIVLDMVGWFENEVLELKKKISIARCARISYNNFEGNDDYLTDIKLFDRLVGNIPRHMSPTEHVAMALDTNTSIGNLKGFKQYRYMFNDQNLKDERVISK
jgi:thymidylate synthase ThyX